MSESGITASRCRNSNLCVVCSSGRISAVGLFLAILFSRSGPYHLAEQAAASQRPGHGELKACRHPRLDLMLHWAANTHCSTAVHVFCCFSPLESWIATQNDNVENASDLWLFPVTKLSPIPGGIGPLGSRTLQWSSSTPSGRPSHDSQRRVVVEHQICHLGCKKSSATLSWVARAWTPPWSSQVAVLASGLPKLLH
ncbi:hypothetical protein GGR56DRAFT_577185 [Xylariaceae sp. FL0804]|nr:hypothetical protein GGR56DRAFT_577185 [Xylariaceae sp. FL0804]